MTYDELLIAAAKEGITVKEALLESTDGRIKGKRIAIRQDIPTFSKKADVLAEELGHYHTTVGNILDQDLVSNQKQERTARLWGYNKRIGLLGLIKAFKAHCETLHDIAEYLDVSEDTLAEAIKCYRQIYGIGTMVDNYFLQFEPNLQVHTLINVS